MGTTLLIAGVVIVVGLFVFGITYVLVKTARLRKKQAGIMKGLGFEPCPGREKDLENTMQFLHCNDTAGGRQYRVQRPMANGDIRYFWFATTMPSHEKNSGDISSSSGGEASQDVETFMFSLKRPSGDPVSLVLDPASLTGFKAGLLSFLTGLDARDKMLSKLDVAPDLEARGLKAAYGPKGAALPDVLPPELLDAVLEGAQLGVSDFLANGSYACVKMYPVGLSTPALANAVVEYVKKLSALP